ncbi:M48 family metallopeptidase [Bounagaea algeriensis]
MRASWRASLALVLHFSFFAVPLGLVLGLFATAGYVGLHDRGGGAKAACAAVFVAAATAVVARALRRARPPARGVALGREEQPKLWRLATSSARAGAAPEPDELRITSEPEAAVHEDRGWLGWHVRGRTVEIGLPLLAGLTDDELRAVLIGEFGRLAGGKQAGTLPGRGRAQALSHRIDETLTAKLCCLTSGPVKWLFGGYVRAYRALAPTAGSLWFAADAAAVRLLGRRVVTTALRKHEAVRSGWREYVDEYLSLATAAGNTPDVVLGFRAFVENATRKPRLAERAKRIIAEQELTTERGRPSTRERLAALRRAPRNDESSPSDRPAFSALQQPRESVPQLEDRLLADGFGERLPWPELVRRAGAVRACRQAARLALAVQLSGVPIAPTIAGVLGAVYHGQGRDLINPVLNPGIDPDRVDQAATDTLVELLGATVVDALVAAGLAQHELDWAGPPRVQLTGGRPLDPDRLVRPAVEDPRLVPGLHRALVGLGVPLQHGRDPAPQPAPVTRGVVSPVRCGEEEYDLVVADRGLVLLPTRVSTLRRLVSGAAARLRRTERASVVELGRSETASLLERTGAQWVDSRDIAAARLSSQQSGWSVAIDLYYDEYAVSDLDEALLGGDAEQEVSVLQLRCASEVMEHGEPYRGLGELFGARMTVDGRPYHAEAEVQGSEPAEQGVA